ncbi:dethiobiotin synthetase [Cetobacterium ceti]|uniref:ATP-dependent dethiobiotin synthetase BioD n=1 Tax=Cetobacterium ceti TaxID=180163 RepID=A0A1T4Q053_9FUSO|nr:dethiobiotin synthase [Cetobacterium ceti]SJZ97109.1 dethiobiotin synthetase [Cetobacterium ceti]
MLNKGYFVIGTDTDIGKTYISSLLYKSLKGHNPGYYKPLQTGCYEENGKFIALDPEFLCKFNGIPYDGTMSTFLFKNPVSPHLASEIENIEIEPDMILSTYKKISKEHPVTIVEAAGGLFVPIIRNKFYMYDLIKMLNLPVVLVASSKVGAINHTMLTIAFLKEKNIDIQGVIFNNYTDEFYEKDNVKVVVEASGINNYLLISPNQEIIDKNNINKFLERR